MDPRKQIFTLLAEGVPPNKIELLLDTGEKETLQRYVDIAQVNWLFHGNDLVAKYIQAVRVVPETIMVNGFEVPAPVDVEPNKGERYFVPNPAHKGFVHSYIWEGDDYDYTLLPRKIIHSTRENAIAHAKAMLGIDPSK